MKFLDGVRVLEFSIAWAGPLAGRWLADLGADVIKVEHVTARGAGLAGVGADLAATENAHWQWGRLPGPVFRAGVFPDAQPGDHPWNRAASFNKLNRNKRSLCIDLKTDDGMRTFHELVQLSDVVLINFSPRGAASLGITYDELARVNPRIVLVSLTGYGCTGPYQARVSWGPILEAHSGLASTTGYADDGPIKMGVAFPDPTGGMHGAFAILAALWRRDETGEGCFVDISQLETYCAIAGEMLLQTAVDGHAPARHGNRSLQFAPQGVYPCLGEDAWVALTVRADAEWARLVDLIADPALRQSAYATVDGRRAAHDAIDAVIAAWTCGQDKHAVMLRLQLEGIAAGAVLTNGEVVTDPHLAAHGFMATWDQIDVGPRQYPGFPVTYEPAGKPALRTCPPLGGDNAAILGDLLGYDAGRIADLHARKVIGDNPVDA